MDDKEVAVFQTEQLAKLMREFAETETQEAVYRSERPKRDFLMSLIRARFGKRLTQAELANLIKVPQSVISRIESGKGNPSLETLLKITEALEVKIVLQSVKTK